MDVFEFRQWIIEDYQRFSLSFARIQAEDVKQYIDDGYAKARFWPTPLIQLNPNLVLGKSIGELVSEGVLARNAAVYFAYCERRRVKVGNLAILEMRPRSKHVSCLGHEELFLALPEINTLCL